MTAPHPAAAGRVLYAGLRFQHHQSGSGYDLVVPAGADHVDADRVPVLGRQPDGSWMRRLSLLLADGLTLLRGLWHPVVHYYYPEDTAFVSAWLLSRLGKRLVFTIHLSDAVWLQGQGMGRTFGLKQASLRHAHAIVTLSSAQHRRFQARFPQKQVAFVPHGYEPLPEPVSDQRLRRRHAGLELLVVGENYRDFDQLAGIIALRGQRPVRIHLVGVGAAARQRFGAIEGVVVHPRLSDQAYAERLDRSFALLLPLSFATANNALLEAHKWALPSFCSDVEGARDYATPQTRLYADAADFWRGFDALAQGGEAAYARLCQAIADDAGARFRWPAVRRVLEPVYRGVDEAAAQAAPVP